MPVCRASEDGAAAARVESPATAPLRGLAWLLVFQCAGEILSRASGLPAPGPVVGLLLLFGGLFHPAVRGPVAACAEMLLAHLSLLFIPVGVGVMTHLALLQRHGLRLAAVIVLSTWAGLGASAWVLHALRDREAGDGDGDGDGGDA